MNPSTEGLHAARIDRAARSIAEHLDAPLDLSALASAARLSRDHFHRLFHSRLRETPLELHRRLRMERAALELAATTRPVTEVAFRAGYETHESFTRAFSTLFGRSPSQFRSRAHIHRERMGWPERVPIQLPAPNGIHINSTMEAAGLDAPTDLSVNIEIRELMPRRLASVDHEGPANMVGEAFGRLAQIAGPAGLLANPEAVTLALFHAQPRGEQGSWTEAAVTITASQPIPDGLSESRAPGGLFAIATHRGDYAGLPDAWTLLRHAAADRISTDERPAFEEYIVADHDHPETLETALYLPVS